MVHKLTVCCYDSFLWMEIFNYFCRYTKYILNLEDSSYVSLLWLPDWASRLKRRQVLLQWFFLPLAGISSKLFFPYSSGTTCTDLKSRQLKKMRQLLAYCILFDRTSHHSFSLLTCAVTMEPDTRDIWLTIHVRLAEDTYCNTTNRTEIVTQNFYLSI